MYLLPFDILGYFQLVTYFVMNFTLKLKLCLPFSFLFFHYIVLKCCAFKIRIILLLKLEIFSFFFLQNRDRINLVLVVQEVTKKMIKTRKRSTNRLSQREWVKRNDVQKDRMLL